jgi:hypothetical protein
MHSPREPNTEPDELIDTKRAVQGIGGALVAAAVVVVALAALALWLGMDL